MVRKYTRLKKSEIDSQQPDGYVKIDITSQEKTRGNYLSYNGVRICYCSIGVCNSEVKPCESMIGGCPYHVKVHHEQPRKNTKKYDKYLEERNIQLEQSVLYPFWDDKMERIMYGECTEEERKAVVTMLSHKMEVYDLKAKSNRSLLIRDALQLRLARDKQETQKNNEVKAANKKVVFEIGEYLYIKISYMPQIKDENGKSLWHKLDTSYGWVLKENFSKYFHKELQSISMRRSWLVDDYKKDMVLLDQQLEENYGLITLIKLED